jgi:hypothetical protein
MHKSPDTNLITVELIHTGGKTLRSEIHKFINCISNKEEFPAQWKDSLIEDIHKKGDKIDLIITEEYNCYQLHTKCYQISRCQS